MKVRRDDAHMQVIEAVLIGMILMAAVSFVVTFSSPTNVTEPTRAQLSLTVGDALAIMDEYPLDDPRYGNNTLSKFVFEALQGKPENLTTRLDGLLPDATTYNVYINNGYAFLPVHEPRLPAGESVSVRHPLEPRLSYVFLHTAHGNVSSSSGSTLGVYALPVWNSNILTDGGADLEIRVQGYNSESYRSFNLTTYYSTEQSPPAADAPPAAQLMFYNYSGQPALYIDRLNDPTSNNKTLYLEVRETEGRTIPQGATLTVRSPRGFTLDAWRAHTDVADWSVDAKTGTASSGTRITLSLNHDLTNDRAVVRLNATPLNSPPDLYDFYTFHAYMAGGAYAQADAILHYQKSSGATGGDFHAVVAAVPKPMGTTGTTTWAVAVQCPPLPDPPATPAEAERRLLESIRVKRIEVVSTSGLPMFAGVTDVDSNGGSWTIGPAVSGTASDRLVWTSQEGFPMGASSGEDWVFKVTGAGYQTPLQSKEHQTASVSAFTHTARFARETAPGLFYGEIPPESSALGLDGYNPTAGNDYRLASLVQPVTKRTVVLPGTWTYDVGVTGVRDSLNAINLTFSQRVVPIGESVTITVDVQNLLLKLSESGVSATTNARLYAPWALDHHIPLKQGSNNEGTVFEAGSSHLALADYTKDGIPDVVVGTTEGEVFVLDGENGHKIQGLAGRLDVGSINTLDVAYLDTTRPTDPYLVLGAPADASGKNLFVLGPSFGVRWASDVSPIGGVSQAVVSTNITIDVNGDGRWLDIIVGDRTGMYFYVSGDDGQILQYGSPSDPLAGGTTVRSGFWTKDLVPGLTATTGVHADTNHPSSLEDSTVSGLKSALQKVKIEHSTGGLIGDLPSNLDNLWTYPVQVDQYRVDNLDGWGPDDLVVGMDDGSVITLNGTQPALPYGGIEFLTGTQVLDAYYRNAYEMWTVGNDGILMYTTDGYTTRIYASDALDSLTPVVGARAIHISNGTVGYVVGDVGQMWKTTNAGDENVERWSPLTYALTSGEPGADFSWKDVWAFNETTLLVGGQCGTCSNHAVFRSTNGGDDWTRVSFPNHDRLDRFWFYNDSVGYALSTDNVASIAPKGYISMTVDGGKTWTMVHRGQSETLRGIQVLPTGEGWAVGDDGTVLHAAPGTFGSAWSNFTGISSAKNLTDVDFSDPENGTIVGKAGEMYRTWDGGLSWVPSRHMGTGYELNRILMPRSDHAMILGGTSNTRLFAYAVTYSAAATAWSPFDYTVPTPATKFLIIPEVRNMDAETDVVFEISPDGGTTWYKPEPTPCKVVPLDPANPTPEELQKEKECALRGPKYEPMDITGPSGTEFLVRMYLSGNMRFPYVSPQVNSVALQVWYDDGLTNTTLLANFTKDGVLGAGSTAYWDDVAGGVRIPRLDTMWEQNVRGEVLDIDVGVDVDGDGNNEVLVSTGHLLDSFGVAVDNDHRVYLLDGGNGTIRWKTPELPGPVRGVQYAKLTNITKDAVRDVVALVDVSGVSDDCPGEPQLTRVYFIYGNNGTLYPSDPDPTHHLICAPWNSVGVGDLTRDGNEEVVVGQDAGQTNTPGYVTVVDTRRPKEFLWRTAPAVKGLYTLTYNASMNSIFGPYIVEVEVTGKENVGGTLTDFTARSINYFLVTPPSGILPTSPIYTVEVVAWFHDWDFAPGADLDTTPTPKESPYWQIRTPKPQLIRLPDEVPT